MKITQVLFRRTQFKYFQRYVDELLQKNRINRYIEPISGQAPKRREDWYYGEHRPWTDRFMQENTGSKEYRKEPILVKKIKNWNMFVGDRVSREKINFFIDSIILYVFFTNN